MMEHNTSGKEIPNKASHIMLHNTMLIVWDAKYNLGIPILDEQHRGIVTTINSLHFAIQNHFSDSMLMPVIHMMNDYTRIHFEVEEAFMEQLDPVHAKRHRELHDELLEKLSYIGKQSLMNHDPQQFLGLLKSWWLTHICNEDMIYRDYLHASSSGHKPL